jgi:hypothetical protein
MCQVSSSAWTAQNHRPQMPQWDVAAELQGSSIGEIASQDHSRLRVSVWFDCCNMSPPRAGSIHLAVAVGFQWGEAQHEESISVCTENTSADNLRDRCGHKVNGVRLIARSALYFGSH